MGCFKQVWSSFWRKNQGIGMIETVILLPIFLMFAFAVMDFGNYLIVKNRIVSANQAIASAIQNNPTMTVSDLNVVIQNSLGDLWFNASGDYIGYTGVAIWTSTTVPTPTSAPGWGSGAAWEQRNITSPWLSDSDPSNDNNAYYVGLFVWRGVPFLTPLPRLLGFEEGVTTGFHDAVDGEGAPNGRKVADSFTFITLNNASCPDGQVLQSMTGGAATCVPRDNNYACESGQTLEKIVDGNPVCVAKDGTYTCAGDQVLKEIKDGAAVCVNRDRNFNCGDYQLLQKRVNNQEFCGDPRINYVCTDNQVLQATYAMGAVCVDKDHGGLTCLPGNVVIGVINGIPQCGGIPAGWSSPPFGGMFAQNEDYTCFKGNPYAGGKCECPSGSGIDFLTVVTAVGGSQKKYMVWCP
jgi:Flp pilus assembly protein TadG